MRLLIDDARMWDGTGAAPYAGRILVDSNRVSAVSPHSEAIAADGAERIDTKCKFLMPDRVEGHSHLSALRAVTRRCLVRAHRICGGCIRREGT